MKKFFSKAKNVKRAGTFLGILAAILIFLVVAGISWIATCGIIKLITLCFGWEFNWLIATGIWLVMFLIKSTFGKNDK
jgi:hypothetical protein